MPSERFQNLTPEKKQRILQASIEEFTRSGYHDASINQIIREADISRGSFYTYFTDKADLFSIIFMYIAEHAQRNIHLALDRNQGDILESCKEMMRSARFDEDTDDPLMKLLNKLMTDFYIIEWLNSLMPEDDMCRMEESAGFLRSIYERDPKIKERMSLGRFYAYADILVTMSVKALVQIRRMPQNKDMILKLLFTEYDMLENAGDKEQAGGKER